MTDSDVIYIPELAKMLGKTETATTAMLHRGGDLPPSFKLGRKHAWRRADVEAWLAQKAQKGGAS